MTDPFTEDGNRKMSLLHDAIGRLVLSGGLTKVDISSIWLVALECGVKPSGISLNVDKDGEVKLCVREGKAAFQMAYVLPDAPPRTWGAAERIPFSKDAPARIISSGGWEPEDPRGAVGSKYVDAT